MEIQSVIIEGGRQLLQSFIDVNLWDEARIFIGDITFNNGINAPVISGEEVSGRLIQSDKLKILKNYNLKN
jgi:diaminohydroxyphosphoribosylaminopyrimidine deaminase/5-amino-6-(5-phosphoribosylamino)uracil reductase